MNLRKINIIGLITGLFLVLFGVMVYFLPVSAQSLISNTQDPLGLAAPATVGLANTDVRIFIAKIIRVALGMLGIIFVVIMLFAGFEWMTAGGNDEKVSQAKKRIYSGAIGLLIIFTSFSLTNFVINKLVNAQY
jgi:uncharacterized protein YpmB